MNFRINWDNFYIGFIIGILSPIVGFFLYYLIKFYGFTFDKFMDHLLLAQYLYYLASMLVLVNLFAFYILLRKDYYRSVYGVIAATTFYLIVINVARYFS